MNPQNLDKIHKSFETQAPNFESTLLQFSKEDYLLKTISLIKPQQQDTVLETAAGTCICGRSLAPLVHSVVCLDATPAMLQIGKKAAEENNLKNMTFIKGFSEDLPFLENSFDIVLSRLSFHHFTDVETSFKEMLRVLKPGGKLIVIDMGATVKELRKIQDEIETLRDPSHVKNLSTEEIQSLFEKYRLELKEKDITEIPQNLQNWMKLTKTPETTQQQIIQRMKNELNGGLKTGFFPYIKDEQIYFNQRWVFISGKKSLI